MIFVDCLRRLFLKNTGKVDLCTGTGRKAFFDFFFGLILDPAGTYASTAKKGKFIGTGHFFSPLHGLLKKGGGDWHWYTFFFSKE